MTRREFRARLHKITCAIDDYRRKNPQDSEVWQNRDAMLQHVRQVDYPSRRLKMNQLYDFIDQAISSLRRSLAESVNDDDDEDDEVQYMAHDSDATQSSSEEEESARTANFMNRMLAKNYANTSNPSPPTSSTAGSDSNAATVDDNQTSSAAESAPQKTAIKNNRPTTAKSTAQPKQKKPRTNADAYPPPNVRYSDLGGIDHCIEEIRELIEAPIRHPEVYLHLNISPPRGVLLHGPPGCGKTKLAQAVAGELGIPFIQISAPSVVSGMSGESEKKIREVFAEAKELAPCLLFLDEIDAITPKRETAQREMERRIVAQLLTCLDELSMENTGNKPVIVIGATNRPDSLDAALRRAGRFDREITMGIPDEQARVQILKVMTAQLRLDGNFDYELLAKLTPGYVGADLNALTTAAGVYAIKRIFGVLAQKLPDTNENLDSLKEEMMAVDTDSPALPSSDILRFLQLHPDPLTEHELEPLSISMEDFTKALKKVQPSSKREGFASVPGVSWSDIGALMSIRDELRMSIVEPIKNPQLFASVGIMNPSGVLLWGPPGCGKTLLAKAVANESHCNFISVKGPELLNKYVGESERGVRQVFARARASAPCVIFFDELDALCPKRGDGSDSQTSERVVNQLLTELDGLEGRKNVYIIAATNRPDIIDRAMLRPGRFDKLLYVKLPEADERYEILKTICEKIPLGPDVDLQKIAHHSKCQRFSGADLSSLAREAGLAALRESLTGNPPSSMSARKTPAIMINMRHFETAFLKVFPSVSEKDLHGYNRLQERLIGKSMLQEATLKSN